MIPPRQNMVADSSEMNVLIIAKSYPEIQLKCHALGTDLAADLLKPFCNCLCLPREHSRLFHAGSALKGETLKQVQRSSDGPVQLMADFVCSIAFHTWQSFHFKQALNQEALPAALETAARAIMLPAALTDKDLLTALVGLEPLSLLPNQISLTDSQPASRMEPEMLVVVLVHLFSTVAHEHLTQSQGESSITDTQRQPGQMQPNADQCFNCIDLLRGALVLFKLIQLAGSVQDPHAIGPAMTALWSVLAVTEKTLRTEFCSAAKDQLHAGMSAEEYREQLQSCLLLVQVIMLVQKQLSKAQVALSYVHLQVCLAMEDVLIRLHHKEVAQEIVESGGLPFLVVAMQLGRELATATHEIITLLLDTASVPPSQISHTAALLAHLQVFQYYSRLLVPIKTDLHPENIAGFFAGRKAFSAYWVQDENISGRHQVVFVRAVASTMTQIAVHDPHRHGRLTEATWQPVKTIVLDKIACGARWLETVLPMNAAMQGSMSAEDEETADKLAECKQQLWTLMHVVLTHHLPNRQLDMTEVINIVLVPVIQSHGLIGSKLPSGALTSALLKRASEDKAVFAPAPANEKFWDSTVSTVSLLWTVSCSMSSKDKPPFKVTVSAALDALHAALTHEVHCQYFLQGKHDLHMSNLVKAAAQPIDSDLSMHAVIDNMEGYLSAQLTAAACVMRLCLSEIEQREEVGKQTSLDMGRYCLRALNEGWFGSIVRVMRLAIKTPMPWTTGHCVGLARALHVCSSLLMKPNHKLPTMLYALALDSDLPAQLQQRLPSLANMTPIVPLQRQFLAASLAMLAPDCDLPPHSDPPNKMVTNRLLIELLSRHTSPDAAVTAASAPLQNSQAEYADVGLAELAAPDACMTLQSSILRCIMLTVDDPKDYFCLGKHVFPICLPPFLNYAQSSMDRYVQTGKAAVTLPDLRPYMQTIMMLGCHPRTTMKTKMSEPPPGAMKALLQTVFLLIHRSQWIHESSCSAVIEARQSADEALKIWKPEANQTRTLLMSLVRVLQLVLNQDIWMSARAALGPWSWCPDKQAPIKLKRWLRKLTAVNALSSVTADEVEQCFVIRQDEASAEASALKVAAELLAEEEQAAVRAAVKKAKKLRQKQAKKQQPQAVKTHSGPSERPVSKDVPTHSADESEPLKGEGHADHTGSLPSAAKQSCSQPAVQDSPSSQPAPVSKACIEDKPGESSSTTSAHLETYVIDGAEASRDATAPAPAAAAALSACSLAQSPKTGLAPSGSCAAKASDVECSAQHADAIFLKKLFCCPITQSVMVDPMIAADGRTYERSAMEEWLLHHHTSPVTGDQLLHTRLVPNVVARAAMSHQQLKMSWQAQ
ncbi:TPA: hypothetical protein ACH3X2_002762 [Trebouxia sp. C0005]